VRRKTKCWIAGRSYARENLRIISEDFIGVVERPAKGVAGANDPEPLKDNPEQFANFFETTPSPDD
jgi:hypothetical protein